MVIDSGKTQVLKRQRPQLGLGLLNGCLARSHTPQKLFQLSNVHLSLTKPFYSVSRRKVKEKREKNDGRQIFHDGFVTREKIKHPPLPLAGEGTGEGGNIGVSPSP
jgi:hypothetical protein